MNILTEKKIIKPDIYPRDTGSSTGYKMMERFIYYIMKSLAKK